MRLKFHLALLAALAALTASAAAQTGGPVADGDFTGAIAVSGGFGYDAAQAGAEGAITVIVDGQGPLELTLRDGDMSGTWSISGTQRSSGTIVGSQGGASTEISITGDGTFAGSGEVGGPPSDYRLTGSITSTNTATVTIAVIGTQTRTTTGTESINSELTDVLVLCQDIVGRWDQQVRTDLQDIDFVEFVNGYFWASTGVDATEQAEEVESLLSEVVRWAGEAATLERGEFLGRSLSLLGAVESLQSELAAPSPCPPDPRFATQLTLAAQDVLQSIIQRFPGITNETLVSFGLGTGAIGGGSAAPEAAAALQAQMEADVQARFDELVAEGDFGDALVSVARTAQMLGMDALDYEGNPNSPTDLLLLLTGSSS